MCASLWLCLCLAGYLITNCYYYMLLDILIVWDRLVPVAAISCQLRPQQHYAAFRFGTVQMAATVCPNACICIIVDTYNHICRKNSSSLVT